MSDNEQIKNAEWKMENDPVATARGSDTLPLRGARVGSESARCDSTDSRIQSRNYRRQLRADQSLVLSRQLCRHSGIGRKSREVEIAR